MNACHMVPTSDLLLVQLLPLLSGVALLQACPARELEVLCHLDAHGTIMVFLTHEGMLGMVTCFL